MEKKFRAWDKDRESYFEVISINFEEKKISIKNNCIRTLIPIKRIILEQYAGFNDINNKEIYLESDIVKITTIDEITGEESYIEGLLYLSLKTYKLCIKGHEEFNLIFADEIEVIGNIHEK